METKDNEAAPKGPNKDEGQTPQQEGNDKPPIPEDPIVRGKWNIPFEFPIDTNVLDK